MAHDALTTHRPRRMGLTDLNRATSAAYDRCVANGGHVDSGERVTRLYPATVRVLPTCANCGCPYGGPRTTWNGVSRERAAG